MTFTDKKQEAKENLESCERQTKEAMADLVKARRQLAVAQECFSVCMDQEENAFMAFMKLDN